MFAAYAECADRLDAWHEGGRVGPRPPGRLRRIPPPEIGRLGPGCSRWGPYLMLHDPDGRPPKLRRQRRVLTLTRR